MFYYLHILKLLFPFEVFLHLGSYYLKILLFLPIRNNDNNFMTAIILKLDGLSSVFSIS